jgi:hypothetical protein
MAHVSRLLKEIYDGTVTGKLTPFTASDFLFRQTADKISCYNRWGAEYSGYWETTSVKEEGGKDKEVTFYDSVTGMPFTLLHLHLPSTLPFIPVP